MRFLFFLVLLLSTDRTLAQEIQVQYLANEGVRISNEHSVVYIDALFGNEFEAYDYLTVDTLNLVFNDGKDRAKNTFILASHVHGDHFSADITGEFLQSNPNTLFISPQETIDVFKSTFEDFQDISEQVKTVALQKYQYHIFEFDHLKITIMNLDHLGESPWKEAINFAYIIEMNGKKIIHFGDAGIDEVNLKTLNLPKMNLDIAIMRIGQIASLNQKILIDRYIAPKHLVAAHIPLSYYDRAESILKDFDYEDVIIFNEPLKEYTFKN